MDRINRVSGSCRIGRADAAQAAETSGKEENVRTEINLTKQGTGVQNQAWQSAEQSARQQAQEAIRKSREEYKESGNSIIDQLRAQADAFKDVLDPKKKTNLYDATMDLMLIEQAEKTPALKAMQSRLLFKIRSVRSSGAKASEIRMAVNKVKKVIGKVKTKVKNLQKEEQLEKKRKKAEEAKRKAKEEALRRELELRRKIRKVRERNDIEESKMGLGANYGGPSEASPVDFSAAAYGSTGAVASSVETGALVDVAAADACAAAVDVTGAIDVSV